jgi:hypothetical protein
MKKYLAGIFTFLMLSPAAAGVPCSLPFNLVNGTVADATQVMQNYQALVTCLGNAAIAGANNDITSLSGLTTPIPPNLGGTAAFAGTAVSTGSANAQIVAATLPGNFTLTGTLSKVVFIAGFTNGTGNTQLNVNATGLKNVLRRTTDGLQALNGGEIVANTIVEVVYDGTQYQLMSNVSPFPVGTVLTTISSTADAGFLLLNGTCQSTTTFAALWTKMGSPGVGGCAAGQFPLPDGRGRVVAMIDSGGSGRITLAGGNFNGTVMYAAGGLENHTMLLGDLVAHNHPISASDSGHSHGITEPAAGTGHQHGIGAAISNGASPGTGSASPVNAAGTGGLTAFATTGITINNGTANITASSTNTGGGNPFTVLQPTLMLNKQVKY